MPQPKHTKTDDATLMVLQAYCNHIGSSFNHHCASHQSDFEVCPECARVLQVERYLILTSPDYRKLMKEG